MAESKKPAPKKSPAVEVPPAKRELKPGQRYEERAVYEQGGKWVPIKKGTKPRILSIYGIAGPRTLMKVEEGRGMVGVDRKLAERFWVLTSALQGPHLVYLADA